ncbi:tRNA 2-selenouridine(34) synthase MnmH [Planctomycetes bacterium K23_9]|uniref:tRNA 2-selenouridine synthase n=1 Tax=Stieleria marina TaxID=1930275 RepID=A0A517NVD2_9BACT|nr:tRNA 2-selenouridine synthase [Planctomycetes bacterium K23_9]
MSIVVDAEAFLQSRSLPIVDVRSPGEFARGHIPSAQNVPLFDDAERAEIGTIYKQVGTEPAIARGRQLAGVKVDQLVDAVRSIVPDDELFVHCWRGGMRSEGFADLLQQHGFRPQLIRGGYKAYRHAVHAGFAEPKRIVILSGQSGSGKTHLLKLLRDEGEQVIDLEDLAGHRGSVFGGIGLPPQPTVEHFENLLFDQWRDLDPDRPIWIEGESRSIGRVYIPAPFWDQMMAAPVVFVEVPCEQRVQFLVQEYGDLPADELATAIGRIRKRLGGLRLAAALEALDNNDVAMFANLALQYYDKAYSSSQGKFPRQIAVNVPMKCAGDPESIATLRGLGNKLLR